MAAYRSTKEARTSFAPTEAPAPAAAPSIHLDVNVAPAPSPALELQAWLAEALTAEKSEPVVHRWPVAATLCLVIGSCGAFWAGAAFAVARLLG